MPTAGKMIINKAFFFFFSLSWEEEGEGVRGERKQQKKEKQELIYRQRKPGTTPGSLETWLGSSLT